MGLFGNRSGYDRIRILKEASEARAKKRRRRAIELYRRVLVVEPENPEIHGRIAPLLAETGERFEAWVSFRTLAGSFLRDGRADQALAVYEEASRFLPLEIDVWQAIAKLHRRQGRNAEAAQALLEGRQHFRRRRHRPQAIYLLRRALEIQPWDCDVVLDLARLLARSRQRYEASRLLTGLAARVNGPKLRRVRTEQFRQQPTPASLWRWLRAALSERDEAASAEVTPFPRGGRPSLRLESGGRRLSSA